MNQQIIKTALLSTSVAGIILSSYLVSISSSDSTSCDFNSVFSCSPVLSSSYSQFMGISVALLGLIWYAIAAGLSVISFRIPIKRSVFLLWAIIGVLTIPYFVYAEFQLGVICLFCTLAHILGLTFLGLTFLYKKK